MEQKMRNYIMARLWLSQTPTQLSIGNEKNTMCHMSRIGFYFNIIYCLIMCSIPNLIFHYFLQQLAKLAVAAWSCLVVASKMASNCSTSACCLSFRSHQFIYNML